jgi:ABC-type multidrug transport system fused ATPase/permease subunit
LENASVKDNILFGHEYDETRFSEVIRVCALSDDISILPAGIHTEIGESGVNLSGGQKARIALARAVYADADVYLLDSPLAAVDAHVASHIHRECILGMLKGKTRIMATHAVQFASDADMVVKLRHGRIVDIATGQSYASISGHGRGHHRTDTGSSSSDSEDMGDGSSTTKDDEAKDKEAEDKKRDAGRLVAEEERQIGGVRFAVMWKFFRYCGLCLVSLVMLFSIAAQILKVAGDFYLASWTERSSANSQDTQDTLNSLLVYGLLGLGFALCVLIRSFLFYQGSLYASTGLHDDMLTRVLRAPLMFFQTTPSGRLLNRFAKDQMAVDWDLPGSALSLLGCVLRVIGVFLVICIVFPLLLLVLVPVFGIYLYVEKLYRKTVLSVKRIESTSRSPIFSHFSTSLRGMSVIRAFGHQTRFLLQNESFIDGYLRPAFISIFLNRWLGQRLEFVGNTIVFATTLLAVLLRYSVDSAQSGLAITYALSVTGTLNWLIRMLVMTEANFTSVERIVEYTEIPVERPPIVRDRRPPSDWPRAGQIEIRDLCIRYRPGLPLALNHVSVFIHAGEKIGVVGRTGSGKSSLVSSLFRLIEFETGSIIVDGVDIRNIGLDDLRSRFTIIPQDPVIFSGTVRMNLDPFGDYEDQRLWAMLEAVQLKDLVSRMPLKLEQPLSESGGNLSVGEAQLLCLARALLRKSRVFVQDEASANIDYQSDQRIQDTIRKECADCTVITIAHRLGTIMDSDRILVLDDGKVAEFDRPAVLATDPSSRLFGLIQATGPENAALLTAVAKGEKKLFGEGAIEDHDRHV